MPHRRRRDADGGPPSSPSRSSAGSNVALRAARERECARALPRSDFWVLSFGKSESLKGNYTRKATDNGVGGDRAVFRRGREASSSCIAPLLFYKKGRNSSQRGRRGGRPRDRPEGKVDWDEGGKRKNNELQRRRRRAVDLFLPSAFRRNLSLRSFPSFLLEERSF